jgi:hypothetical protein
LTVLFDRLAYMDRLKRAGLDEEHARAITEALEQASHSMAARTDRDIMPTSARIESKLDAQEIRKKAFWKTANNFGPMLFFGAALGVMLAVLLK